MTRGSALAVLELSKDAVSSEDEIRRAYLRMAQKWHPSRFALHDNAAKCSAEAQFKRIVNARDCLLPKRPRPLETGNESWNAT